MLPRHVYLSATMLALAATMSEEDSPVVPSPDDLDAPPEAATLGHEGPESHWSKRADEAAQEELCRRDINAFTEYVLRDEVTLCKVAPNKWAALNRHDARPEQREHKKARAKRKARKGWA